MSASMFAIPGVLCADGLTDGLGVPLLIAIGLTIAGAVLFVIAGLTALGRARAAKRTPSPGEHADAAEARLAAVRNDGEDLAQILAERLDEKAERIERLLHRADDRLLRLEAALDMEGNCPQAPPETARWQPAAPRALVEPKPPARNPPARPSPATGADALTRKVYALADQGQTPVQIAKALNQAPGTVQLMLALRRV